MREQSYFRTQTADRDPADLIDPMRQQMSYAWFAPASLDQPGVSVCASIEDLATYLAQSGVPYGSGEWVIVELLGDRIADANPNDAEYGELLVYPTEIVSTRPMDADFFDMIGAACEKLGY